jgi:two-component system, cell cycle sensor histidine kinase and response regulator CckA
VGSGMTSTRVLLIDDDETRVVFVRNLLNSLDHAAYALEWSASYADGLSRLGRETFDAALVELRLGARNGLDLIREAVSFRGDTMAFIVITGYGDRSLDLQARESGAIEFLDKADLTPELLDRTLRYAVRQSRAHRMLREREERFRALLQHAWDAIFLLDPSFHVQFASDSATTLTGHAPGDLLHLDFCALIHPDDVAAVHRQLRKCRRGSGSRVTVDCRARHADGSWRDCELTAVNRADDAAVSGIVVNYRDVTERKRAETERRYLADIVQSSQESIIGTTPEGIIRSWNAGAERLFGYTPAEVIGRAEISTIVPDDQRATIAALQQRVAEGATIPPFEAVRTRRDGGQVFVSLALSPIRDADGRVAGISAVARDITAERLAQLAVLESEREYRSLFDTSPVGMAHASLAGRWIRVNRRLCAMLGFSEGDLQGQAFTHFLHPDDGAAADRELASLVDGTAERLQAERWWRRRDGSEVWIRSHTQLHRDAAGVSRYLIMALEDISAFKAAEEQLRRTVDQLRAVVSSVPMALWALDRQGTITLSEGRLLSRFGWRAGELVGQSQLTLYAHDPPSLEATRRALAGEQVHTTIAIGDGVFETWYTPLVGHDGAFTGTIGIAMEITDRLRLEEQLRQSQKMEAVGRLAGGVAHDFNNLLTAIIGYGELALGELPPGSDVRADVEEMFKAGQSAAALTRQLLAFSRRQVLQLQSLDVNAIVTRTRSLLARVIGEDIRLTTELDPTLPRIIADPSQIEQIVMNLVVNARDAMPAGGRLTIRTSATSLDARYVRTHPEARTGPHVRLDVIDTGTGMTSEVRARLFEPFFTTKERGKGTGLGLPTVYGIVRQTGGSLEVESEPGKGATFSIFLPIGAASEYERTRDAERAPWSVRGTETVLLVEDQAEVLAVARDTLRRHGYRVLEAEGPEQAVVISSGDDPIDLLLTDVVLPGMSGHVLAARLQDERPTLRVLLTSGYADERLAMPEAAGDQPPFLQKPFTSAALLSKVREVLDAEPRRIAR